MGEVESAGVAAIERLLVQGRLASAWYANETRSTNSVALEYSRNNPSAQAKTPMLFLADRQVAGRGRHGRTWQSDEHALTLSLMIDWEFGDDAVSRLLSVAVGTAIASVLEFEFAPLRSMLKWPNDVWLGGGKVAGILIESASNFQQVVVGIGLNVSSAPELPKDAGIVAATSVAASVGRPMDRYGLLEPLVAGVLETVDELRTGKASDIVGEFRSRCVLTGQLITFDDGGTRMGGRCVGIRHDGGLLVETAGVVRTIFSGEANRVKIAR
ncbi:Bifunctional ligase/repressor BirA [Rubripirellula tenax]|uniref:Bifunctional ligase/repressor BirA n=1 Tax=Rubripirellula tenax TaxID=2528015 RepID=A0A5C6EBY3_9BACT|nr:biotin--[acetyl-CoA-carboxylase] ligase [Rubripirellula tenax]TWU47293.1 Bifunctional ligase/repressor BirA [Rubripirellula tenax]